MNRPRILLIGGDGQVGWELRRTLAPIGDLVVTGPCEPAGFLDLTNPDAVRDRLRGLKPDLIVNPAAYTAVDQAEKEQGLASAINALAPAVIAEEAKALGALMVHWSTDYVFDGETGRPYREDDASNPQGVYGSTKLDGEKAVAAVDGAHLIFRTAWVYGLRGKNFLRTMLRLGEERDQLGVVDDQHGSPNWSRMLAQACAAVIGRTSGQWQDLRGVYHLSSGGETSWCGFARAIFDEHARRIQQDEPICQVKAITTQEYPTPARRPARSTLDCSKLASDFGIVLPHWREALELCMADGCF
ncbi:MAG: dTDP-4-dehydrorhamnose reductase [Chromatiales bacterium]|nr:dTDP-4-dehydrorhamnose reductase [Chromatiales bacterium]